MRTKMLRNFGETYLDFLIAAEIVSRGTGPAKYMHGGTQNTILFDTCLLSEDELPEIWHDPDIIAARELALVHPEKRPKNYESDFAEKRRAVFLKYYFLMDEARKALSKIPAGIEQDVRRDEFVSLSANYRYAGFNIGILPGRDSFGQAQQIITGERNLHNLQSIAQIKNNLEGMLSERGISAGTLAERMRLFDKLVSFIPEDEVLPEYDRLLNVIARIIEKRNNLPENYIKISVETLPDTEKKTGSFEYEGSGRAVAKIKIRKDYSLYWLIQTIVHEAEHMEQAIIKEQLYNNTKDLFSACATMCTSTANIDEGWGNFGPAIFSDIVKEFMGDKFWGMEIAEKFDRLKDAVINYIYHESFVRQISPGYDREKLREENEKFLLSYGFPPSNAAIAAEGTVNISRQHKNLFYTPFYGAATDIVQSVVDKIGFEKAFEIYTQLSSKTRLSTQAYKKYALQ